MLFISNNSFKLAFVYTELNDQRILFLIIHFNISYLFHHSSNVKTSIWPIERTLSNASTLSQSGLGSNGNKGVFHILQSFTTGALHPEDTRRRLGLTVGVFNSIIQLGYIYIYIYIWAGGVCVFACVYIYIFIYSEEAKLWSRYN